MEFWLNQYNYNGSQGDLLTQAQVEKAHVCNDTSHYYALSIDAKSRGAYASALPAETGALLQQWVYLLLLFSHLISSHLPHAGH